MSFEFSFSLFFWADFVSSGNQVIVTSWLYPEGRLDMDRLRKLSGLVGKDRLVLDLRCAEPSNSIFPGPSLGAMLWFW